MTRTTSKTTTVKQATFDLLRSFGVDRVFGNPGSTEMPFLADWPKDIDYVLGLQEASVVGMADGYAQATRNAAFVNLHSAAGVGHALGNIYTAHRNQTPLVIIAGQQSRSILPLQPFLYAERASEFPRPYVKYSVEPARAQDVLAAIARAYHVAMTPPCGPAFVSVPADDWAKPATAPPAHRISREICPDPETMRALVDALGASERPAFVIGAAVDRAAAVDLMVAVVEQTHAAVWVAPFSARCSFPETHPQFMGFLHASPEQLSDALSPYDVIVTIGAPAFTFHVEGHAAIFDSGAMLFQITDDPDSAAVTPAGTSILATMKPALRMLRELLPEATRPMLARKVSRALPPAADPIPAEYLMHALSQALPKDAALVEEAPSHRPAMQTYLAMRGQDSFYTMASGGLGWALPAAVGIALGRPERRTVCLIGDGSAMYSIQALWTAAQRKLPLTIIVINNQGYGAMRSFSRILQARDVPGLDLPGLDIVSIAQGFGCAASRVTKAEHLAGALAEGLAHDGVCLIDVTVDSAVPLLYAPKR